MHVSTLAELPNCKVTIQCDLCVPPVLTINTRSELRRTGWLLRSDDQPWDVCSSCAARIAPRHRKPRRDDSPAPPDPDRMPNVVVIGAAKSGTTSMHNYLGLHPDIAVSAHKELRFFQDPDCLDWAGIYQDDFAAGTRFRAEATPFYTKVPCFPGVVDRMADLVPDAHLIYLVRDPVERIVAEYVEQVQWHATSRSIEDELLDAHDLQNWLVSPSRYATQLREFLRRFDPARIKVIDLAELSADPAATLEAVFEFLGADRMSLDAADFHRFNAREEKLSFPGWVLALRRGPVVRTMHRLPEGMRKGASRLAHRRLRTAVETPQISASTLESLRRVLQPEVDELRTMTGCEFRTWSL